MDADDIDILNLLRNTTSLANPAKVSIFDVSRQAKGGRTHEIIVHVHDLGPDSHPDRFSAVATDKHDPARRIASGFYPDVKAALDSLHWSQLD